MGTQELREKANDIRIGIVKMGNKVGPERKAHPGPGMSAADIVAALFFKHMNFDPENVKDPNRDRFVLSKGHSCPVLYSALRIRGVLTQDDIDGFRHVGSMLQGHPDMKGTPGIDMTTGSLGHGLSAGIGMALAARMDNRDYRVYVLLGDGEIQEGLVWEAAMVAPKYGLDNLIAIIDRNDFQSCGSIEEIMPTLEPLREKWASFNWNVIVIDGNDMEQADAALTLAERSKGKPSVIIANTTKGKGVSFMENDNSWHQKALTDEQLGKALTELGERY
jgi:transketolase